MCGGLNIFSLVCGGLNIFCLVSMGSTGLKILWFINWNSLPIQCLGCTATLSALFSESVLLPSFGYWQVLGSLSAEEVLLHEDWLFYKHFSVRREQTKLIVARWLLCSLFSWIIEVLIDHGGKSIFGGEPFVVIITWYTAVRVCMYCVHGNSVVSLIGEKTWTHLTPDQKSDIFSY